MSERDERESERCRLADLSRGVSASSKPGPGRWVVVAWKRAGLDTNRATPTVVRTLAAQAGRPMFPAAMVGSRCLSKAW